MELKYKYFKIENTEQFTKILLLLNMFSNLSKNNIETYLKLVEKDKVTETSLLYFFETNIYFAYDYFPEDSFLDSNLLTECTLEELLTYEQ